MPPAKGTTVKKAGFSLERHGGAASTLKIVGGMLHGLGLDVAADYRTSDPVAAQVKSALGRLAKLRKALDADFQARNPLDPSPYYDPPGPVPDAKPAVAEPVQIYVPQGPLVVSCPGPEAVSDGTEAA